MESLLEKLVNAIIDMEMVTEDIGYAKGEINSGFRPEDDKDLKELQKLKLRYWSTINKLIDDIREENGS